MRRSIMAFVLLALVGCGSMGQQEGLGGPARQEVCTGPVTVHVLNRSFADVRFGIGNWNSMRSVLAMRTDVFEVPRYHFLAAGARLRVGVVRGGERRADEWQPPTPHCSDVTVVVNENLKVYAYGTEPMAR